MSKSSRRQAALQRQLNRLEKRIARLQTLSNRFSWYRLLSVGVGLAAAFALAYFASNTLGWITIVFTLLGFNIIAYFHRRLDRSIRRHEIWHQIKIAQIARIELHWGQIPENAQHEQDPDHPFEIDLDITGKFSVLRLVDTSISQDGCARLRAWLLETHPKAALIRKRQAVVREITPLARFRDKLLLAFYLVSKRQLDGKTLLDWVNRRTNPKALKRVLIISSVLGVSNVALFVFSEVGQLPALWVISLTIYLIVYFMNFNLVDSLLSDSNIISDELRKFREVLRYLEGYRYGSNHSLRMLCQPLVERGHRPSDRFRQVTWLSAAIGFRMNPIVRLLINLVPWDFFLVNRINRMKALLANDLPAWLEVLTELEASVSLANFAYLNPEYTFPEISATDKDRPLQFEAEGLGHPLIPRAQCVGNDFRFGKPGEIVLVTGSNMSGKSTFLKTLGVNLSLAFAGGPVNARSMRTSLFKLYSCIKINDSVTDGFSFFYAEVRRLRALLDELKRDQGPPMLFLIDEIFKGTNNRERLIGSRSYIRALIGQNGLGAVSTHDLELTQLANKFPDLVNYHFREQVQNSKMVFDYELREGPCPTTNALKIMEMEGLPVEET